MTDTPGPGLDAITRDDLLHALTCFYLAVRDYRGHQYAGQIEFPDKVADALYATLSRIAAERKPDTAAGVLHRDPAVMCEWQVPGFDPKSDPEPCQNMSWFAVERSDGASPVAALPDMDHTRCEACEYHLAEVVGWMLGGDDSLRAIVTPRWWDGGPEADQ